MRLNPISALLLAAPMLCVAEAAMPPEVAAFIEERNACEHFMGEPYDGGDAPEMVERREFIFESFDIYCAGTDRRLAALRKRYRNDPSVLQRLRQYEDKIE